MQLTQELGSRRSLQEEKEPDALLSIDQLQAMKAKARFKVLAADLEAMRIQSHLVEGQVACQQLLQRISAITPWL